MHSRVFALWVLHVLHSALGAFHIFFSGEHAVIAPVFQRACNPKSVRRKYFFKEENVFFVNFLNLSSIQLGGECTSKLLLGLGCDFC